MQFAIYAGGKGNNELGIPSRLSLFLAPVNETEIAYWRRLAAAEGKPFTAVVPLDVEHLNQIKA